MLIINPTKCIYSWSESIARSIRSSAFDCLFKYRANIRGKYTKFGMKVLECHQLIKLILKFKAWQTLQSLYFLEQNHRPSRLSRLRLSVCLNIEILANIRGKCTKFGMKVLEGHQLIKLIFKFKVWQNLQGLYYIFLNIIESSAFICLLKYRYHS